MPPAKRGTRPSYPILNPALTRSNDRDPHIRSPYSLRLIIHIMWLMALVITQIMARCVSPVTRKLDFSLAAALLTCSFEISPLKLRLDNDQSPFPSALLSSVSPNIPRWTNVRFYSTMACSGIDERANLAGRMPRRGRFFRSHALMVSSPRAARTVSVWLRLPKSFWTGDGASLTSVGVM